MEQDIASRSLSGRIVLLCLADLERADSTPVHTAEVIQETRDLLDAVTEETMGTLSESAVNRALNRLEADGFVEMAHPDRSTPAGKGRPMYSLAIEADQVLSPLSKDDEVAPIADSIRSD